MRIAKAFSEFESEPAASASLGQVHLARLRDGRRGAVKVQRPGIRDSVLSDLDALYELAEFVDRHSEFGKRYQFRQMLEEFRKSLSRELDYRQEAQNLTKFHANMAKYRRIIVPLPIDDYCTARVLTMEYVPGKKVTDMSPLARMGFDGEAPAKELFRAYLEQILVQGFFHADPHPGNVFITEDYKIALLDLGMVGRITSRTIDLRFDDRRRDVLGNAGVVAAAQFAVANAVEEVNRQTNQEPDEETDPGFQRQTQHQDQAE